MLDVRGVTAGYGGVMAISDISLNVARGEIVSVLGANGAGKSTLLKVISGLLPGGGGLVSFQERDVTGLRPDQIAETGLIQVPQGRRLFTQQTVLANLLLGNTPRRARDKQSVLLQHVFEMFPILSERREQMAGTLSGGQQQMVAIGRALMADPELLILDEPSIGLAPAITEEVLRHLVALNTNGLTVLLIEQNVGQALAISNRAYVIENGTVSLEGEAEVLRTDDRIRRAYLGV